MKRTASRAALAALTAITLTASAASAATTPSYQEFRDSTYVDEGGVLVVNGDEPVHSNGELRQFYDAMVAEPDTQSDGLIVNRVSGRDDVWTATQAANLSYCVSDRFGSQKADVVNAMNQGTALWEGASTRINFTYVPAQDSRCTTRNSAITFSVEPTSTTQYIARAFFPSTPKSGRNVLVNARSLMSSGSWTPGNIMGHELGHVLGLRHEHTRPEARTCFEDNNWRPLTPYDSASIMHYPQCNGSSSNLQMTETDRAGIRALYGS